MLFRVLPLRFSFVAREPVYFPPGKSSNILRGAFGTIFRRIACVPTCSSAAACDAREHCPYARFFEPSGGALPSGLADHPRPFVFRALHLDGQTVRPGQAFYFDLNLFDLAPANVGYLVRAFAQLASEGLGPGRGQVELTSVETQDRVVYKAGLPLAQDIQPPVSIDLSSPQPGSVSKITVRFLTPTELKSGSEIAARPEFGILANRARDRVSTLSQLYGDGPLDIDFREFGAKASRIEMTRCDIRQVEAERRSSKTGQSHQIGGFVGEAEYAGELAPFLPILDAAKWTGIGRQTVWGKGRIVLSG